MTKTNRKKPKTSKSS